MGSRSLWLLPLAIVTVASPSYAYTLDDPLQGSSQGQVFGGSLGANGFTTTGSQDAIVYVVPGLLTGSFEYTVTGLTQATIPNIDHEILSMYEGDGMGEPVDYSPYYRNNNFKMMLRIYGQGESSRTGQQKFLWVLCPAGPPGYNEGCPCANSVDDEPFGGDANWTGGPDVIRVEWTRTSAVYFRNGSQVLNVDWSSSGVLWGPQEQHIMIGSPRNQLGPDVAMPVGITFSNVHINGEEGTPTPTCETGVGGSGGEGGQGGSSGGGAAGTGGGGDECSPALSAVSISPSSGSGDHSVFEAVYRYTGGASQLRIAQLFIASEVDPGVPNVNLSVEGNKIYYEGESCTPGESKVLDGTHATVDCSWSSYSATGNDATVRWAVTFKPAGFSGTKGLFMDAKAQGTPEPRLCWTNMGQWNVTGSGQGGSAGSGTGATDGGTDAKPDATAGSSAHPSYESDDGCGCRTSTQSTPSAALWSLLGLVALARRKKG